MDFIISAKTDIGMTRKTNQDSLCLKKLQTSRGIFVFAVLCDGLGGYEKGEAASASVVRSFDRWAMQKLPCLCSRGFTDSDIQSEWESIVRKQNRLLKCYGEKRNIRIGTTAAVLLLTQERFYICNVGDTRIYMIKHAVRQLTTDQTLVNREVLSGKITDRQAQTDPRRNILLQCVGVSDELKPEMIVGNVQTDAVYMLCTDGFCRKIGEEEMYDCFDPDKLSDFETMSRSAQYLTELNKRRGEQDNITVALIRTCREKTLC